MVVAGGSMSFVSLTTRLLLALITESIYVETQPVTKLFGKALACTIQPVQFSAPHPKMSYAILSSTIKLKRSERI